MEKSLLFDSNQKINAYIVRYVETQLTQFKQKSLSYSHYEILRLLSLKNKRTFKDISTEIIRHKSTVTVLVRKLFVQEFVYLEQCTKDKRKVYVCLTVKGKAFKGFINSIEQKLLIQLHKQFTTNEQQIISSQFNRFIKDSTLLKT